MKRKIVSVVAEHQIVELGKPASIWIVAAVGYGNDLSEVKHGCSAAIAQTLNEEHREDIFTPVGVMVPPPAEVTEFHPDAVAYLVVSAMREETCRHVFEKIKIAERRADA
jgi:hypothetical protein